MKVRELFNDMEVYKELENETIFNNYLGQYFRYENDVLEMEVLKQGEDRISFGKDGFMRGMLRIAPIKGTLAGDYVLLKKDYTEEDLEKAREEVIEKVCDAIRKVAKETPELVFIEKHFPAKNTEWSKTVACKVDILVP